MQFENRFFTAKELCQERVNGILCRKTRIGKMWKLGKTNVRNL